MSKPRLYVPEGSEDRRGTEDYKTTRIGFVIDPQPESTIELVTFDAKNDPP